MTHILLVEPDAVLAKTYCRAFERAGCTVMWATHAQAAIDAADARLPAVIVLELQLAGHSGIEFLYEFRSYSEWQDVPIIVHTLVPPTEFGDMATLQNELGIRGYHYKLNTRIAQLIASMRECSVIEQ